MELDTISGVHSMAYGATFVSVRQREAISVSVINVFYCVLHRGEAFLAMWMGTGYVSSLGGVR